MKKTFVAVLALSAAALLAPGAYAAPCGESVPMFHGLDSYLACDNSRGPVTAFAYQVANPTAINTGTEPISLELGPSVVQISTDWGNGGIAGCPRISGVNTRVVISVQANDGTGALLSLSGADPGIGYLVEAAHTYDPGSGLAFPVQCGNLNGRPIIRGINTTMVDIHVDPPVIKCDCDPDSVGVAGLGGSTCPDAFDCQGAVGHIFTSIQACGTKPNVNAAPRLCSGDMRTLCTTLGTACPAAAGGTCVLGPWTQTTVALDGNGDGSVPYTKPDNGTKTCATDPTCLCFYVGTTTTAGGVEGGAIGGFIQVGGSNAAPPSAENVRGTTEGGKVKLSWSTSNEAGLAGFRIIAVSKNKGQFEIGSLVAAKGTPSSYTAEVRMGDLKGSRSIIIRSVLTDGTTVDSAPVNF